MTFEKAIDSKEWLESEFEKFSQRGKYTYKVKNQAYEIVKVIEREESWSKNKGISKHFTETHKEEIKYGVEVIIPLAKKLLQYRCFQESDIHCLISNLTVWEVNNKNKNFYYDFKKLVNMVNAYWDITDEKPAHRIAWGWEKAMEKDNPRAYLYGCIRNYLKRNGKFDKDEFNNIWFGRNI